MSAQSLQEIVNLPLTSLRYGLADKLLRIRGTQKSSPLDRKQVNKIIEVLSENEVRIGQIDHLVNLHEQLLDLVKHRGNPGELIWDMIVLFRMIQGENKLPPLVQTSLDRVMVEWQGIIFPKEELKLFLKSLRIVAEGQNLEDELLNASEAIREGLAPSEPDLSTPEKQLLWAAHLLYLVFNPELMGNWSPHRRGKGPLEGTQLWRQLLRCKKVRYLRALYASHIFNLLKKNDLMVGWGAPGSWFSYSVNPAPGRINCDLLYSMLAGFDHSRACVVHEIGHAMLTRGVPPYIQDLSDAIQDMESDDEAYGLGQELRLKQYFLNACEDNCINRFTQQIGRIFGQDYGYSLNHFYTSIGDVGRRFLRQREIYGEPSPENRFKNLTFIISRVFLANNNLFENSIVGWRKLMAQPDWITARDRDNPEEQLENQAAFRQLLEMCEEVEHYYPPLNELAGGPLHYGEQADAYASRRFDLIHEMWDLFAKDIVDEILDNEESEADDAMEQFEAQTNHTPPPPNKKEKEQEEEEDDDNGEGEDEEKEKNPSPPSQADQNADDASDEDLEGEPPTETPPEDSGGADDDADETGESGDSEDESDDGEESDDTGEEGEAPPQTDGSGSSSEPQDSPDQKPEESDQEQDEQSEQDPSEQEGEEGQEQESDQGEQEQAESGEEEQQQEEGEGEEVEQEGGEEEGPSLEELVDQLKDQMDQLEIEEVYHEDDESEQKYEEVDEDDDPEAEMIKEIEDSSLEPEMKEPPTEEEEKQGDQGADHGGTDSQEVMEGDYLPEEEMASISDLMEALKEADEAEEEQKKEKEKREERREEREEYHPPVYEPPTPMGLDALASGSWENFSQRVTLHGAIIGVMADALKKLKTAQLKFVHKLSKRRSLIPQGGDLRRFDMQAMYSLIDRLAKNEKLDKEHLNMFRKDGRVAAVSRPTRVILIDGSRSMSMGNHPLPMDKAIQEAVIDYMASRIAGYDTYITMFGPKNPIQIAKPGDSLVEIGKTIEKVHGGLNTMTYLSPALMLTIQQIAFRKKFEEPYVGFTNFVIYSDGDIDDLKASKNIIQEIFLHAPKSTFDFVLITSKRATPMDVLINTTDTKEPIHQIGVVRGNSSRKYPMALTATIKLTNRLRQSSGGFADPSFLRSSQFKRLFQLLTTDTER